LLNIFLVVEIQGCLATLSLGNYWSKTAILVEQQRSAIRTIR
jgi:hypothetical protein